MDSIYKIIVGIIIICLIAVPIFYFAAPRPEPNLYHTLTIDTHGISHYTLTIESKEGIESLTIPTSTYDMILNHGRYNLEACYYNVNNTLKCESQSIWLDEDVTIDFFVDWLGDDTE